MKVFFFVLLAMNAVLLVLFQPTGTRGSEPMKGHEPFQSERVKLVSEAEMKVRRAPEPEKSASSPAAATTPQCLEWGAIAGSDMGRAKLALQKLKLWEKASARKMEKATGYWVYVPPRKSLAEAQKKADELKRRGIDEIFVLQENTPWRYAISLGVFSTEEAAAKYLAQLQEKGVRSAETGPRSRETEASVFTLRNFDATMSEDAAKLKQEFPGSEIKVVDCS